MAETMISKPIPDSRYFFDRYISPNKRYAAEAMRPRIVDFELTSKCGGACTYCYASSPYFKGADMPTEQALAVIDDLAEMGVSQIQWCGGDPILHPDWQEIIGYAGEKGLANSVFVAGIVAPRVAQALADTPNIHLVGINFDTVDEEDFMQTHTLERVQGMKYKAFENLRNAGFHPSRIMPCLTLTKPAARSIERTLDFLVDEMGAGYVPMFVYHPIGEGGATELTPSLDDIRRAYAYRAEKLGQHWLRVGPTECGRFYCRSKFHVTWDGRVLPCAVLYDFEVGNVNQTPLKEILASRSKQLCYDFEVTGECAACDDADVCWGCRANAYFYKGDVSASDPMCWRNSEDLDLHAMHDSPICQSPQARAAAAEEAARLVEQQAE